MGQADRRTDRQTLASFNVPQYGGGVSSCKSEVG